MSVARCLEINARLRANGITVREAAGWQSRGNGQTSAYEGGLVHHTATGYGIALPGTGVGRLLINGRPDLRGPLCNYAGNDDGSITVIAAHPANHAGASGGRSMGPLPTTTSFNRRVLGLEIVYPGTRPMRPAQYRAALVWANAVAAVCGRGDLRRIRAHAETSVTGKWDPGDAPGRTIDMAAFRDAARDLEADVTPEEHRWLKFVHDRVAGMLRQRYYVRDPVRGVREVSNTTPGAIPTAVLDTLDGSTIIQRIIPLLDDETRIISALHQVRDAAEVTPEQVGQLAEVVAESLPRELVDEFGAKLRAAYDRTDES